MSDERKRAEDLLTPVWGQFSTTAVEKSLVDAMLAFADAEVARERATQENTIVTLNRECDQLNDKVCAQIKIIEDVAMMGRRLSYALKRAGTNDALVHQCVELFKKYDLGGSIVRADSILAARDGQ